MNIIPQIECQSLQSLYTGLLKDRKYASAVIDVPSFQRQTNQWDIETKQKFIESLLYSGIPLTQPFLLGKLSGDNKVLLLDGLQRISTTLDFINCKFKVINPETDEEKNFDQLDNDQQDKIRQAKVTVNTLNNIQDLEQAYQIFVKANNGVELTPFQKQKGYKELSKLCNIINKNESVAELLVSLKIVPSIDRFYKENKREKFSELIVSLLCLNKNRDKYSTTSSFRKQWGFHKKELDGICSQKLDENYWNYLNKYIKSNLTGIDKELSEQSKVMILYTLLSLDKSKLVNKTSELNSFISNNGFEYIEIRNSVGKLNDAASRAELFKRTNLIIDDLNNVKRTFSNTVKSKKLQDQDGKCGLCNEKIPSIEFSHGDHIKPFSKGGTTTEDNLMILCEYCNKTKGDKINVDSI